AVLEFGGPVALIEHAGEHGNGSTVQAEAVVDQAAGGVFGAHAEQANVALRDTQGEGGGGNGRLKDGEIGALGFARGVDAAKRHVIGGEGQAAALGLTQKPGFKSRVGGSLKHDFAGGG